MRIFLVVLLVGAALAVPSKRSNKAKRGGPTAVDVLGDSENIYARAAAAASQRGAESPETEDETFDSESAFGEVKRAEQEELIEKLEEYLDEVRGTKRHNAKRTSSQPNIIFMLIDDLGFNDVGWNNPEAVTPSLDAAAGAGMILDQNYVQPVCSPSRGALMTGMYAYHLGFQHGVIAAASPECAPSDYTFLPEELKTLGYDTHMLGKWHLGFCNWNCTPTYRGFDTFYGFYQGYIDHYTHMIDGGYDWRDGEAAATENDGEYSTDLLTARALEVIDAQDADTPFFLYFAHAGVHSPFQAPQQYLDLYPADMDEHRRTYLAMISAIDDSFSQMMGAVEAKGMLDNTIVIFSSDNGAEFGGGSNYPLRGAKTTVYEGGMRVPGFVYSPLLSEIGVVSNEMIHVSDWYPTLLNMAGGAAGAERDGIDQTEMIFNNGASAREETLFTIDDVFPQYFGTAALRQGDFKIIAGFPGLFDGWEQVDGVHFTHSLDYLLGGNPSTKRGNYAFDFGAINAYISSTADVVQLYNVIDDPLEMTNLAESMPDMVSDMLARLDELRATAREVDLDAQVADPAGQAENFGGIWTPGWCDYHF